MSCPSYREVYEGAVEFCLLVAVAIKLPGGWCPFSYIEKCFVSGGRASLGLFNF